MAPSPHQLRHALEAAGLDVRAHDGWDNPAIGKYPHSWNPVGVVLHHTANGGAPGDAPSLAWCLRGTYPPTRNCHLLVARSGVVHLVYALGCYHAGAGGPMRLDGVTIARDTGNRLLYGIEIESKGTRDHVDAGPGDPDGFTPAQVHATAAAAAALLDLLDRPTSCAVRHRDWAPGRKTDVLQPLAWWHDRIDAARNHPTPTHPEDPDMPLTDAEVDRVARRTVELLLATRVDRPATPETGDTITVADLWRAVDRNAQDVKRILQQK